MRPQPFRSSPVFEHQRVLQTHRIRRQSLPVQVYGGLSGDMRRILRLPRLPRRGRRRTFGARA